MTVFGMSREFAAASETSALQYLGAAVDEAVRRTQAVLIPRGQDAEEARRGEMAGYAKRAFVAVKMKVGRLSPRKGGAR